MTQVDPPTRTAAGTACDACGTPLGVGAPVPGFEIPVPASLAAALGLGAAPATVVRRLCPGCLAQGLGKGPVTLAELVDLAPTALKQAIHEQLIHEFEI